MVTHVTFCDGTFVRVLRKLPANHPCTHLHRLRNLSVITGLFVD